MKSGKNNILSQLGTSTTKRKGKKITLTGTNDRNQKQGNIKRSGVTKKKEEKKVKQI